MNDIYLYFAVIYVIMTLAQVYAFFASGNPAKLLFALFTINLAATHFHMALLLNGRLLEFPNVYGIYPFMVAFNLAWGMVWFLYRMQEKKISRYMLEFSPAFAVLLLSIPAFYLSTEAKLAWATNAFQSKDPLLMPVKLPLLILFAYMILMLFNIQRSIAKNIYIKNVYLDFKESGYKFNTILAIYAGLFFTLVFSAANMMITVIARNYLSDIFYVFLPGAWLLLTAFLQILDNYAPLKEFNKRYAKEPAGYSKSQLKSIDLNSLENRLEKLMQEKKLYRNETLTLQKLARQLEVSPQQLSEFLNSSKKSGYREYVNSYRIEEAKKILIEKPELNASLVGFEVGFPSVSGFYKIFKKQTRMSPADFRKWKA